MTTTMKKPSAARAKTKLSPEMKSWRRRINKTQQSISTASLRGIGSVFELVLDHAAILGADIPDQFPVRSMARGVAVDMKFETRLPSGLKWRQSHCIFIPHSAIRKASS